MELIPVKYCVTIEIRNSKLNLVIVKPPRLLSNLGGSLQVLNREPFLVYQFLLHIRRLIPSNLIHYRGNNIPFFFDCELVQKGSGIGRRLALIEERKFVKFTGITPRPFP